MGYLEFIEAKPRSKKLSAAAKQRVSALEKREMEKFAGSRRFGNKFPPTRKQTGGDPISSWWYSSTLRAMSNDSATSTQLRLHCECVGARHPRRRLRPQDPVQTRGSATSVVATQHPADIPCSFRGPFEGPSFYAPIATSIAIDTRVKGSGSACRTNTCPPCPHAGSTITSISSLLSAGGSP